MSGADALTGVELPADFGQVRELAAPLNPLIPANAGTQIIGLRLRMAFYVYIVASGRNGTIYIGSTDDIGRRVWEHKSKARAGFTKAYGCDQLVWFESFPTRDAAFTRERRIKEWRRSWKLMLIEEDNPTWRDLYDTLNGEPDPDGALSSGSRHSPG